MDVYIGIDQLKPLLVVLVQWGKGDYIHPLRKRVITPHEAARIQGFSDFFDFSMVTLRGDLHNMIANAVPPKITAMIVSSLLDNNILT